MTDKENEVAANFKKLPQCEDMLNVHCISHQLTLICADTGDDFSLSKILKPL